MARKVAMNLAPKRSRWSIGAASLNAARSASVRFKTVAIPGRPAESIWATLPCTGAMVRDQRRNGPADPRAAFGTSNTHAEDVAIGEGVVTGESEAIAEAVGVEEEGIATQARAEPASVPRHDQIRPPCRPIVLERQDRRSRSSTSERWVWAMHT